MKVFISEMGDFFAIYTGETIFVHIPEQKRAYIIPPEKSDKLIQVEDVKGDTIESICARAKEQYQNKSLGNS